MTEDQWTDFHPYFTAAECGAEMDYDFMCEVLDFRKLLGYPMHIIDGFATAGHSEDSYHYSGRALDFWTQWDVRYTLALIDRMGVFNGAGFYPRGAHNSFHIDNRPVEQYQRWLSSEKGQYLYLIREQRT